MKLSPRAINGIVISAAALPIVGVVTAICAGEPAWLFLCFAFALFL